MAETAVVKAVVTGDIEACKDPSGGFANGIEHLKNPADGSSPRLRYAWQISMYDTFGQYESKHLRYLSYSLTALGIPRMKSR